MNLLFKYAAFACTAAVLAGCGAGENTRGSKFLASEVTVVEPIPDDARISSGIRHSLALLENGDVVSWGGNEQSQLGESGNTFRDSNLPILVGLSNVKAVRAGGLHSLALRKDGTVWAWGDNRSGQLGGWQTLRINVPVPVSGMSNIKAIAAGEEHSVALTRDGVVWGWGRNGADVAQPITRMQSLPEVTAVAAGGYQTVALTAAGSVYTWGANHYGNLGNGSTQASATPVVVFGLSDVKAIAAGRTHTLALKSNGSVWAWGSNTYGEAGLPNALTSVSTPFMVSGLSGVKAIAAGEFNSAAIKTNGTVWVWGNNSWGQVGDTHALGLQQYASYFPVMLPNVFDAVAVSVGSGFIVVVKADGSVISRGYNGNGQLGMGYHFIGHSSFTPVRVQGGQSGSIFLDLGKSAQ
jgi:alpha-tubulin suppressor-like RCC1 family protein